MYVDLVHEVSARVVTVLTQRAKEGTARRGGRAPTRLNDKLNGGELSALFGGLLYRELSPATGLGWIAKEESKPEEADLFCPRIVVFSQFQYILVRWKNSIKMSKGSRMLPTNVRIL